jgi:hypothetical protein
MADLFLSYTSYDRPWAERLFKDLRSRFPDIKVFWDQERASLPQGDAFRPRLQEAAKTSTHLVVLWSQKAKDSNEVGPEIQAFDQHRSDHPELNDSKRRLFYVPLDASDYGYLKDTQGLMPLRDSKIYDPMPAVTDRGLSKLSEEPHQSAWTKIVNEIGMSVEEAHITQPVTLAVFAITSKQTKMLEQFLDERTVPGPTLNELLKASGLSFETVSKRYHEDALSWQPFLTDQPGTERTIVDLMVDLNVEVNANLSLQPQYKFRWKMCDLLAEVTATANGSELGRLLNDRLGSGPALLMIDLITLYHPAGARVFSLLAEYAKREQTVFISLAPTEHPSARVLYQSVRSAGLSVLKDYFLPHIPATGTFSPCGLNVPHALEIERLVRGSLGVYHRERGKAQTKDLVSAAP